MSEKKHNYVYKITNLINNKIYIGVHSTDDLNDGYMGSGRAIKNAIRRYGVENFKKEILVDFETAEIAYRLEKMLVDEKFINRKDTYNAKVGGAGGRPSDEVRQKISEAMSGEKHRNFGKHHSEETKRKMSLVKKGKRFSEEHRKKMSEVRKGKHHSKETKRKISEAERGEKHHFFGKHHSEATRKKMSEARKGKPWSAARREAYERKKKGTQKP